MICFISAERDAGGKPLTLFLIPLKDKTMLAIESVSKLYADGTQALSRLSMTIEAGRFVMITGKSGCGKSTLLRLIAGLDQPSAGAISIDGEPISGTHPAVGVVFQEPRLLPWLSISGNVGFGLMHLSRDERKTRVGEALRRVGLADHAKRWPRELSGGQQQRASIARALVAAPKILLLDEPFSALDALTRADLQDQLLALWQDSKTTIVMVTHDVEEALLLADRVIVLRAQPGHIVGDLDIAMARPRLRSAPDFQSSRHALLSALDLMSVQS